MSERAERFNKRWANVGCDIDLSGLFFDAERSDLVDYLTGAGWQVSTRPRRELVADYGLVHPDDEDSRLRDPGHPHRDAALSRRPPGGSGVRRRVGLLWVGVLFCSCGWFGGAISW